MITATRIIAFICTWAFCDKTFPTPEIPVVTQPINKVLDVSTKTGTITGYYMNTISGNVIGAYEGIPYAESPIGNLRFRDPVPKKPWIGTLVADRRVACIQMDPSRFYRVIGDEDCLFLNIYVPLERAGSKAENLPVIFWIHGGGWFWGSGSTFGPSYLLDYNVILVTINYRLGPLGFLSTGNSEMFGNFGLKDQSLALQWIVDNIKSFGGNPKEITLAGHSAGAASVHLHMMSPKSKGKFQRGISLSGSALNFWATPPNQTVLVERLGRSLGCATTYSRSLVDCLRRRPAHRIVFKQYDLFELLENPPILLGPVVEYGNPNGFLLDTPIELYRKGEVDNIPWVTGVTRDEGDLFTLANYIGPLAFRSFVRDLNSNIPIVLQYNRTGTEKITAAIKKFYFGESPKFSFGALESARSFSEMIGDRFFYSPFHKAIQMHSKYMDAPFYAYYFTFDGRHSLTEKFNLSPSEWGVMHMDELQYLFNCSSFYPPLTRTSRDYIISRYFTDILVNFANGRKPIENDIKNLNNAEWEPYTLKNPKLLEINFNGQMVDEPYQHRLGFWNSIQNYIL